MKLREVNRTATIAWSPSAKHLPLLATGTVAGALDASFSTNAELEIFDLNLNNTDGSTNLRRLGSITSTARFNRLAWGLNPDPKGARTYGILAGGMENGELNIWDPHARHSGPVCGLEFNPIDPKILASAATDGEIFIWDLKNPTNNPYSPGTRSQKLEDITTLAWNRQAVHILATASNNGNTVIWDLRNRRELITLSHPGGRKRITGIAWNPENATRIITSADDDNSPTLLMWDLRNHLSPERVFQGHSKGALALSWCAKDSDLIVSCGKDNRTIVWNGKDGRAIGDLSTSDNWAFDIQWCARNPDLISVASFDGKVSVHSIQTSTTSAPAVPAGAPAAQNDDPFGFLSNAAPSGPKFSLPQPPKWLRRPCGGTWGFGGRFVSFVHRPDQAKVITIKTVATEPDLARRALELNQVSQAGATEKYIEFCKAKSLSETNPKDKEIWRFLSIMFESSAREQILQFLGFNRNDIGGSRLGPLLQRLTQTFERDNAAGEIPEDAGNELDIPVTVAKPFALFPNTKSEDADIDNLVMRALITGDFEAAVKVCFSSNRSADALMLAFCGGPELLRLAQEFYFKKARDSRGYIRVLQDVLSGNLRDIAEHAALDGYEGAWKDILALICTYAKTEDLSELFGIVGHRLEGRKSIKTVNGISEENLASVLCFLGAGNMNEVVKIWMPAESSLRMARLSSAAKREWDTLQSFVEKTLVFRKAVNFVDPNLSSDGQGDFGEYDLLYRKLFSYAKNLAEQGLLEVAWNVLEIIPDSFQLDSSDADYVAVLRDRLYRSGYVRKGGVREPRLPFAVSPVALPQAAPVAADYSYQYGVNQGYQPPAATPTYNYAHPTHHMPAAHNPYGAPSAVDQGFGASAYTQSQQWNGGYSQPAKPSVPIPAPPPLYGGPAGGLPPSSGQVGGFNDPPPMLSNRPSSKPPTIMGPFGGQPASYQNPNAPVTNTWQQPQQPVAAAPLPPPPMSGFTQPPPPAVRQPSNPSTKFAPTTGGYAQHGAGGYAAAAGTDAYGGYPAAPSQGGYDPSSQPPMARAPSGPPKQERTMTGGAVSAQVPQPAAAPASNRFPFGDRSHIPAAHQPLVNGLDGLMQHCKATLNNPQRRRELEDTERKVANLVDQLNNSEIADDIIAKLFELVKATQGGDFTQAHRLQVELMTTRYNATSAWILGIKRLIDTLERANTYR
ncbi:hypothetical protein BC829DRAFT_444455 [Chytridium lagenaria]|nr:hypothetical protein BC829DRAFT_444455 [Chytridium lagenaria]